MFVKKYSSEKWPCATWIWRIKLNMDDMSGNHITQDFEMTSDIPILTVELDKFASRKEAATAVVEALLKTPYNAYSDGLEVEINTPLLVGELVGSLQNVYLNKTESGVRAKDLILTDQFCGFYPLEMPARIGFVPAKNKVTDLKQMVVALDSLGATLDITNSTAKSPTV